MNPDDIWNAVIDVLVSENKENTVFQEASTVYQYYSELESGGHESLLNWQSEYIEDIGITTYLKELISILEKIGAHEYANIVKKYGLKMWEIFMALENDQVDENEFLSIIEKANNDYANLNGKLEEFLASYFVNIYTELIEVVED